MLSYFDAVLTMSSGARIDRSVCSEQFPNLSTRISRLVFHQGADHPVSYSLDKEGYAGGGGGRDPRHVRMFRDYASFYG
jgi:hypothetical protein